MKIKATMRYHHTPVRMAIIKNADDAITYLQGSSGNAEIENRLEETGRGRRGWDKLREHHGYIYTTIWKTAWHSWPLPQPQMWGNTSRLHLVCRSQPTVPGCDSAGMAERSYPSTRSGVAGERSYPTSKARGSQEEPPRARGQGWRPGGATPWLRSGGCAGAGGPRGAIPR